MLNNKGLVEYAQNALNEGWGYVWGTFGLTLTEKLFQQKLKQYPDGVGKYETFIKGNWLNKKTTDCVGLIKSYLWHKDGKITYNSKYDTTANGMYSKATEKGSIDSIPEIPGICLWRKGHIGVYVGDGKVIEAKGTKYGVVQTSLEGSTWTHWLRCPFISYEDSNNLTWIDILQKTTNSPQKWEKAINTAVKLSEADSDLGDLEIFKYLPKLIEKIYVYNS